MKQPISKDDFCKLFGKMFQGLSVPASMGMLGAAREPWAQLKSDLDLFGWPTAEEGERAARGVIDRAVVEARNTAIISVAETLMQLVRIRYGNLDPDVNKYMEEAQRLIDEAKGVKTDGRTDEQSG